MRLEDRLLRLAQIEAANYANAAGVRLAQRVAEQVAARRQERAGVVPRDARGILRDNSAHVDEKCVGAEVGDRGHERGGIYGRIGFTQVRLQEPNRFAHPPPALGGRWL